MRLNDRQSGKPGVLFKDTKANISSISPEAGSIAFAADTNELGYYTGNSWIWVSSGGGGGGSQYISDLLDVDSYSPYGEDRDSILRLNPVGDTVIFSKPTKSVFFENDFFYNNVASFFPFYGAAISSGTMSASDDNPYHPEVIRFSSSSTANSGYRVQTTQHFYITSSAVPFARFYLIMLTSGNTGALVRAGFHDSITSTAPNNGIYLEYNGSSPYVRAVLSIAGSHTYSNQILVNYNTWYKFMLTIYGSEIRLSILDSNNGEINSVSINSSSRPSNLLYAGAVFTSSVTSQAIASVDYMAMYYTVNR